MGAQSLQSCLTLCDPMNCSPTISSVHGILQQESWSGLPCFSSGIFLFRDQTQVPYIFCIGRWVLNLAPPGSPLLGRCSTKIIYYLVDNVLLLCAVVHTHTHTHTQNHTHWLNRKTGVFNHFHGRFNENCISITWVFLCRYGWLLYQKPFITWI